MRKPLAGKRAFEAMGRSASARGLPLDYQRAMRVNWPRWAREAWSAGWIMQKPVGGKYHSKTGK